MKDVISVDKTGGDTSLQELIIELLLPLSSQLFSAAHDIYVYRDTVDWHDESLGDAQSDVNDVAERLSRNSGHELRDKLLQSVHSLLISKLPEKMVRSEIFEGESDGTIEAYNSAIDEMHRVIDEMFRSDDE